MKNKSELDRGKIKQKRIQSKHITIQRWVLTILKSTNLQKEPAKCESDSLRKGKFIAWKPL